MIFGLSPLITCTSLNFPFIFTNFFGFTSSKLELTETELSAITCVGPKDKCEVGGYLTF